MPLEAVAVRTINFTRKRDNTAPVATSTQVTQRWPVTRSRAARAEVAHLIEHSNVGQQVWQWHRTTLVSNPPFYGWATPL